MTPRQEMCLLLLLGGMSQAAAARILGVHAMTVWRWMREGTLFNTIYQERLQQLWESHRREASDILKASLEEALNLMSRNADLKSLEDGIRLFKKAKDRLPPYFQPCPSDYQGCCPHIPGPSMSALEQLEAAMESTLKVHAEHQDETSPMESLKRLSSIGHMMGAIWGDCPS